MAAIDEPTDHPLLDRLRRALGARYRVDRFLDEGGMGQVYLARDLTLERLVAVKVIPPELATAVAVERFHREAKILADLSHPNVMPVYDFGESDGLLFYTMQYIEGETLKARITRGPIPPAEALAIAKQLLDALDEAHRRGIVHRDVKPSNVMLVGERVLLTDFGIAKRPAAPRGETITRVDVVPGTRAYIPPEATWGEVTTRSDLYSAGMVIYEALTGRLWQGLGRPEDADWSGVPAHLRRPLARALALAPGERWPDAQAMSQALTQSPWWSPGRRVAGAALAVIALAIAAWIVSRVVGPPASESSRLTLAIPRLAYAAGPPQSQWLTDSITARIRRSLDGPDVSVVRSRVGRTSASEITGDLSVSRDTVQVTLTAETTPLPAVPPQPLTLWRAVSDSAAIRVWHWMWRSKAEHGLLPEPVTPGNSDAFQFFLHGELLVAQARWYEAWDAYLRSERLDSTCLLCSWRLYDVARWLSLPPDTARYRRLFANASAFPPHYQTVIRAAAVPAVERIDSLEAGAERARDFRTVWFHLAEELFHRGPLVGRSRREAERAYTQVTRLDSTFVPAWHHLTWLRVAEGDRPGAEAARFHVRRLDRAGPPPDSYSRAFSSYVEVGFAWRFQPADSAQAFTESVLADPRIASFEDVGAGARFLLAFDAPRGAIAVGRLIRKRGLPTERSTLLAEVFGYIALGRPDSARRAGDRLRMADDDPDLALFTAQLDAALALFGPRANSGLLESSAARLGEFIAPYPGADERRRRAAYLLTLLDRQAGRSDDAALLASAGVLRPVAVLLDADGMARRGDVKGAIALSQELIGAADSSETVPDPFFRTVHHLLRASWYAAQGNVERSRRELGWFENADIAGGYPREDPKNAEVDWAFGTEARWRRARLLDAATQHTADVCRDYDAIVRHWSDGEPAYAARSDTARARLAALNCSA